MPRFHVKALAQRQRRVKLIRLSDIAAWHKTPYWIQLIDDYTLEYLEPQRWASLITTPGEVRRLYAQTLPGWQTAQGRQSMGEYDRELVLFRSMAALRFLAQGKHRTALQRCDDPPALPSGDYPSYSRNSFDQVTHRTGHSVRRTSEITAELQYKNLTAKVKFNPWVFNMVEGDSISDWQGPDGLVEMSTETREKVAEMLADGLRVLTGGRPSHVTWLPPDEVAQFPPWLTHCRVCGIYARCLPWGTTGEYPSHNICRCCGCHWGCHDYYHEAVREYRKKWLAEELHWAQRHKVAGQPGPAWFSPANRPDDWNVEEQMKQIPLQFL